MRLVLPALLGASSRVIRHQLPTRWSMADTLLLEFSSSVLRVRILCEIT